MTRILLLSDTHSYIDERILSYAQAADEIWHAGDIGSFEVTDALEKAGTLRAVYGNIDDHEMRSGFPETQYFECEKLRVLITHIAQYPGRYSTSTKSLLQKHPCDLLISGHSHILKVAKDHKLGHLHLNPGAAGVYGFHQVRTALQFTVNSNKLEQLQVIEFGQRGALKA
jgi:uncharacterized protein